MIRRQRGEIKEDSPHREHEWPGSGDIILFSSKPRLLLLPHSAITLYICGGTNSSIRSQSSGSNHFPNVLELATKSSVHEATGDISYSHITSMITHTGDLPGEAFLGETCKAWRRQVFFRVQLPDKATVTNHQPASGFCQFKASGYHDLHIGDCVPGYCLVWHPVQNEPETSGLHKCGKAILVMALCLRTFSSQDFFPCYLA